MTIEQRLEQLEKRNKRLTVGLTMMAVAMAAVVTMAAKGDKDGEFDTVVARKILVKNDAHDTIVGLGADDDGHGWVTTWSAKGKMQVVLSDTDTGGLVAVYNKTGQAIVHMYADEYGNGVVYAGNRKGKGRTLQPGP